METEDFHLYLDGFECLVHFAFYHTEVQLYRLLIG
jgi:hypothetical protein